MRIILMRSRNQGSSPPPSDIAEVCRGPIAQPEMVPTRNGVNVSVDTVPPDAKE